MFFFFNYVAKMHLGSNYISLDFTAIIQVVPNTYINIYTYTYIRVVSNSLSSHLDQLSFVNSGAVLYGMESCTITCASCVILLIRIKYLSEYIDVDGG